MMSHFYSPLHHMYHSMHSSSLHPHGRYPGMEVGGKYPGSGYPEQKYDPGQGEASSVSGGGEVGRYEAGKHNIPSLSGKCGQTSPGSSPHQAVETSSYHQHEENRSYPCLTPPAGQVTPDIKPHHEQPVTDTEKDLSESSIEAPGERPEESSSHLGGGEAGYGTSSGYYHHSDLSHPSYGGYSTAGPFPLSGSLARPRSNKNKSNSGQR